MSRRSTASTPPPVPVPERARETAPEPTRPARSGAATRARILAVARAEFAGRGYEGTTIRAVAAVAGVDPALVMRYFVSKAGLFAEAAELDLALPALTGLTPTQTARALVGRFFEVWEEGETFLVLLRAAATSEVAAERLRGVFETQAAPALALAALDRPRERAALVGAQIIGFAYGRYVLRAEPLVAMSRDDVLHWLGPAIVRYLTDPEPDRLRG